VSAAWTIKDSKGRTLSQFAARSRLEVARKVVPTPYDAFRLQVSASYRELFDRDLRSVLARNEWRIVQVARREKSAEESPERDSQLELQLT
jgi:hypothetical protein